MDNVIKLADFQPKKSNLSEIERSNLEIQRRILRLSVDNLLQAIINLDYQSFSMSKTTEYSINLSDDKDKNTRNSLILLEVERLLSELEY